MIGVNDATKRVARVREFAGDARFLETVRLILGTCPLDRLEPVFHHGYLGARR